jgi:hypothetical protein
MHSERKELNSKGGLFPSGEKSEKTSSRSLLTGSKSIIVVTTTTGAEYARRLERT